MAVPYLWRTVRATVRFKVFKSWVSTKLVVHFHILLASLGLNVFRAGSRTEQHSPCFYWFTTYTQRHTPHAPLRQSRTPTLALPQWMSGSCVSQGKNWRNSPHPPPHFLAVPPASPFLVFCLCTKQDTLCFALKGYWTPSISYWANHIDLQRKIKR